MDSFRDAGALALPPSNTDGGAEEGSEGDAVAASPVLPHGLDLSLAGDSENDGARRRLTVLVHQGDPSAGSAEDIGLRRVTSTCSVERSRG